jgi:NAD(P)-dependent dehydrogenase (short-subunit alcohol dehydrogenase family)
MIDINLTGVWRCAKAVAPHMIERQAGSIVLISSLNGLEGGAYYAHYTAAKHGVVGLMRAMALELGPHGVRVNTIHPGAVETPMTNYPKAWDMYAGHPGGTKEHMIDAGRRIGILRGSTFLAPEEIAKAAMWLNSDLASSVTGVTLPVDSGHMAMPGVNQSPVV